MPNKPVKIVHIVEGFTGGIATYMESVLPELVIAGKSVTLIYSAKRTDPDYVEVINKLRIAGIKTIELPFQRKICMGDMLIFLKLLKILKTEKIDILHAHCAKAGFLVRIVGIFVNIKAIYYTPHCFISCRTSSKLKAKFYLLLEKTASLLTNNFIFVSESEKKFASQNSIKCSNKSKVIKNGIRSSEDIFSKNEDLKSIKNNRQFNITFAGRLISYKNPDLFIKAAALLKSRNFKFLICGEGPEFENLEELIFANNLTDKVHLAGYVQNMSDVYINTDIFVICSDAEGLPYALLEAMAYGCACVGVRSDGITDVLVNSKTGLICEKTAPDIAKSIENLISNSRLREKLGANARKYISNHHNLKNQIESLDCLYNDALSETL